MRIVILGLSITSSWGNGHATTFRGLARELAKRGHEILFLERDVPWYATHRDLPRPPYCRTELYASLDDLRTRFLVDVSEADFVMVGSYVPEGVLVGEWVTQNALGMTAFYDIDTPVTLAKIARGDAEYLTPALIPRYDLYLSFTGGPTLQRLEQEYGSPCARPLYCSVDPELYYPEHYSNEQAISEHTHPNFSDPDPSDPNDSSPDLVSFDAAKDSKCSDLHETVKADWDLGYMGTYSEDRQPPLETLLLTAARCWKRGRFVVAGPQYPDTVQWPDNVKRIEHLPPAEHSAFYNAQRFTLNITRADMIRAGYSPSVRLFEAAACGVPIISDYWEGLTDFFAPDAEILIARTAHNTLRFCCEMPESERVAIGEQARQKVLAHHTAAHRALELESYLKSYVGRL